MASKFLLALSLTLLVSAAFGERLQLSSEQQCRIHRISAAQPSQRIQSEGGYTEMWDQKQNQFQCAGVVAMKNTLSPNALSLPNYHPYPRLVYIERGQGFIGINFPGCAETYNAPHKAQYTREAEEKHQEMGRDLHQKVHRIRAGDVVAIPAGSVHWCYNDGSEELIAVSINDLNHRSNQLDQKFRAFYLAGGVPRDQQQQQQEQGEQTFGNVFESFDSKLMAEAYNVPEEIMRRMQQGREEGRGLSVIVREPMTFMRPEEEQQFERRSENGLEETLCAMKIRTNIDNRREADIYSRQAGKLNVVDRNKLPILRFMDMSAEKGNILPNAMLSPEWATLGHSIVYVTRGDAQIQVADNTGKALMKDRVKRGDMFVVPQYFTSTARAGNSGFEWVAFKTSGWPMRNPVAGYTSVMRAMPIQVLTNAYQMSPNEAHQLKMNRGSQTFMLSPGFGKRV